MYYELRTRHAGIVIIIIITWKKNDLVNGSKILLDTNLKIILLNQIKINFFGTLKIMSNAVKNVDILAISLNVLYKVKAANKE